MLRVLFRPKQPSKISFGGNQITKSNFFSQKRIKIFSPFGGFSQANGKRFNSTSEEVKKTPLSKEDLEILTRMALKTKRMGILEEEGATQRKLENPDCNHRTIFNFLDITKQFTEKYYTKASDKVLITATSVLSGNVMIWPYSSIWYGSVIRGDHSAVKIGSYTNIQDNSVITDVPPISLEHDGSVVIGHFVTIGHGCYLKGCTVESNCLVGMGSVLEEGSYMEKHSMLGTGSTLQKGARVLSGQLWIGKPAKFVRNLTGDEIEAIEESGRFYFEQSGEHKEANDFNPHNKLHHIDRNSSPAEF